MLKVLNALDNPDVSKTVPKSLECLRGNVFLALPYRIEADGVYIGNSNCYELEKVPLLDATWNNFSEIQK